MSATSGTSNIRSNIIFSINPRKARAPVPLRKASAASSRADAFSVPPDVVIDNSLSHMYSVIEVSGLDRPGLLFDLTLALSKLNLNIGSAHIVTFGEKAVDVFYVTDLTGAKVINPARQAAVRRHLLDVFGVTRKA